MQGFPFDMKETGGLDYGTLEVLCASEDDFACFRMLLGENDGNRALHDTGLFRCDFAQRVAEEILVVEIDAGDDGDGGRKNVGGIEAAAEAYFEFGVFEVGLGGRLDATNILTPAVSVITRVDFDHENFLGHSLREIAAEKAGIVKRAVPVVLAEQHPEAREIILARAKDLQCPVIEPARLFHVEGESLHGGFVRARVTETASGAVFELAPSLTGR